MIRIAIVDDEPTSVERIKEFLLQYQTERKVLFEILTFSDGDEITENYRAEYDLILLDVEMRFMDGMTAAELIRGKDQEVVIIFITNLAQYAIKGYTVNAFDYVLKPVSYFSFSQKIDRVLHWMNHKTKKYLTIAVKGGPIKLNIFDICYVESQGHRLIFHMVSIKYTTFATMKEVEERLSAMSFLRCNKGYLVNLAHVDGVTEGSVKIGGESLLISRGRKKVFMEALTTYLGGLLQ